MKTWLKTTLITGVLCCAVGTVLFAAGTVTGGKDYVQRADLNTLSGSARKDDSSHIAVMNQQKISDVDALDLSLDSLDLKIVPSADDSCYLSYRIATNAGKKPLVYSVSNGTLHLKENDVSNVYVDIDFLTDFLSRGKLPEEEEDVQTVILSVPQAKLKQMNISSSYSDISLRGVFADSGSIQCANGDIDLEHCQLSNLKLNNNYGDVEMNHCTVDTAGISLSNGEFDAESTIFSGKNTLTNDYGDISISDTRENLNALTIQADTSYGDISTPDADDTTTYYHDGTKGSLQIHASNGDIDISDESLTNR